MDSNKLNKKLFYTDPLAAAYMAYHYDVKFEGQSHVYHMPFVHDLVAEDKLNFMRSKNKYYIHPDSHAIFEPQEGDLVSIGSGEYEHVCKDHKGLFVQDLEGATISPSGLKIIQRNNKPFFHPEVCDGDN